MIKAFFTLVRWQNLLLLAFAITATRYLVILPPMQDLGIPELPAGWFICYAFSTVLIAAAGYVINDFYDVDIDRINKPGRMILGRQIELRQGLIIAILLYVTALVSSFVFSMHRHSPWPALVLTTGAFITWWYAASLKKKLLLGNLAVACMSAAPVLLPFIFEVMLRGHAIAPGPAAVEMKWTSVGVFIFALFLHFIREIVKDAEDKAGDRSHGCNTVPIAWGIAKTMALLTILTVILGILVLTAALLLVLDRLPLSAVYMFFAVFIPLTCLTMRFRAKEEKPDFSSLSRFIKLIMVSGLGAIVLLAAERISIP